MAPKHLQDQVDMLCCDLRGFFSLFICQSPLPLPFKRSQCSGLSRRYPHWWETHRDSGQMVGKHESKGPNLYYLWAREVFLGALILLSHLEIWGILLARGTAALGQGLSLCMCQDLKGWEHGILQKSLVVWGGWSQGRGREGWIWCQIPEGL